MPAMNMLLRDIRIPIRDATISGYMLNPDWLNKYGKDENPGLCWDVTVQTEEQAIFEETDEETVIDPRLSWTEFSFPNMRRWFELEGQTVHFDESNKNTTASAGFSYFDTHELMRKSTLKFVKRAGNKFEIHWEGVCDPLLKEPYYKDVPFLIQTEAAFQEISIQASQSDTDATTLERLSKYLDPADFIQHPMQETVRDFPVENRFGLIDPLLRQIFRYPNTRRYTSRYSIFEPRV